MFLSFIFFSILSPSNYEIKRDISDRKDSCTDDVRITFNGIITKKSNIDGPIKSSTSKSLLIQILFFFCFVLNIKNFYRRKKRSNYLGSNRC